ncbi:Integrase catalytic core protein [Phytophthora cinnamomi]|uniref:Integrase catalytic core protein n=1 Tax=Phytophthora cinnamomi TaxID=4785 RepID=UPI00355A030A|nr:Integrase catalytic core protein [Phytophthora cinnamomi]
MVPHTRLDTLTSAPNNDEVAEMRNVSYRQVVGSLLYLARVPRPDIGFTLNQLACHCSTPLKQAWDAAVLLRYLSGTQELRLKIRPNEEGLSLATDADFTNDLEDRKLVSGHVIKLFGTPIAWGSAKQSVVAQSSTAAEFIAADDGLQQADWIKLTVDEILQDIEKPVKVTLFIDNLSTIHRIKKEGSGNAQKAVDIRFHALKDAWRHGQMAI